MPCWACQALLMLVWICVTEGSFGCSCCETNVLAGGTFKCPIAIPDLHGASGDLPGPNFGRI